MNYTLDDHNLFYVFAARGYKPGGFNSSTSQFNPETVWDYEGGWKSTLLDGHLRTQLGAFYNRYYNFQFGLTDLTSGTNGVQNLTRRNHQGLRVAEVQAQIGAWAFDGGIAYVDSNLSGHRIFRKYPAIAPRHLGTAMPGGRTVQSAGCVLTTALTCKSSTSGPNLYSPKLSFNAGIEYRVPLSDNIFLTPRLNYGAFVGSLQYTALSYSPLTDITCLSRGSCCPRC